VPADTPIFIVCRDRVTPLITLVDWLERAGHERIYFVDNASTYPPLLEYLDRSPHVTVRLADNAGHLAPWEAGVVEREADGEWYVVTDPDVVPIEACPFDAVDRFQYVLERYPDYVKAGFGLQVDDLPSCFQHADDVRHWESQWEHRTFGGKLKLHHARVDTTFALYRPFEHGYEFTLGPSIRTSFPYVARHLPWYADSSAPTAEEQYYAEHSRVDSTSWHSDELPVFMEQPTTPYQKWSPYQWVLWRAHVALKMSRNPRPRATKGAR
jgi:hypothetical protein